MGNHTKSPKFAGELISDLVFLLQNTVIPPAPWVGGFAAQFPAFQAPFLSKLEFFSLYLLGRQQLRLGPAG